MYCPAGAERQGSCTPQTGVRPQEEGAAGIATFPNKVLVTISSFCWQQLT